MPYRCSWGTCRSDSRYPNSLEGGVKFITFPQPKTKLDRCLKWIKMCGRPHEQLNVNKINYNYYVCTKHFHKLGEDGKPSPEFPDPIPATNSVVNPAIKPTRRALKRLSSITSEQQSKRKRILDDDSADTVNSTPLPDHATHNPLIDDSVASHNEMQEQELTIIRQRLESQITVNEKLQTQIAALILENEDLQRQVGEWESQMKKMRSEAECKKQCDTPSVEQYASSEIKGLLRYYTGFDIVEFENLCSFLHIPGKNEEQIAPLLFTKRCKLVRTLPVRDQFLMVLMKLRNDLDLMDLACRFRTNPQSVSILLRGWINFLYFKLGEISFWPSRSAIKDHMPPSFKVDYPNTFAILDCTELKIEKPSSLKLQSQCYSDYKSTTTLKSLVACDPAGSILFASTLFTGSMSDKEIFTKSGLAHLLKELVNCGYLMHGDGIMADKGFNIFSENQSLGLNLNLPPFASAGKQMSQSDVELTKKIAKHRVHVERAIAKVKKFKIVSRRFKNAILGSSNQIWFICCMLSNFQAPIIANTIPGN